MSGPIGVLASNTQLATRNSKFQAEIEPECSEDLFFSFGLHLNLGAKFRSEIEPVCDEEFLFYLLFFWSSPEFGGKIPD